MSNFGKQGRRCDGCGIFTNNKQGEYDKNGRAGRIGTWGRNCPHEFCNQCEAQHGPPEQCGICGQRTANMENDEWNRAIELKEQL